jgi:hypothetical protein
MGMKTSETPSRDPKVGNEYDRVNLVVDRLLKNQRPPRQRLLAQELEAIRIAVKLRAAQGRARRDGPGAATCHAASRDPDRRASPGAVAAGGSRASRPE